MVDACIRRWGSCRAAIDAVLEEGAIESTPVQRMQVGARPLHGALRHAYPVARHPPLPPPLLPPQMMASEIQEFCRAMASARVALGEGLRCARAGTILYRHLFSRMVDLQWYVFCAKMLKQMPPFTDQRHAEELRRFAEVSPEDVVTLLVDESERLGDSGGAGESKDEAQTNKGPSDERERRVAREAGAVGKEKGLSPELARAETVQAMRVLARHAEPLQRVFHHYRCAAGPLSLLGATRLTPATQRGRAVGGGRGHSDRVSLLCSRREAAGRHRHRPRRGPRVRRVGR